VLDYHLHLWRHGPRALEATIEQLARYCEHASANGVTEIALTEHLFRFDQADAVLRGWWNADPDPALRDAMATYWDEERGADLDRYVEVVLAAKAEGLPVVLGLEVDFYPGRMADVARLLDGYPFDVLLGSVHWLGAWGFDNWEVAAFAAAWESRAVEDVWRSYTDALEELAASGTCDVLAHPDLVKVYGRRPGAATVDECHARMAEAAARSGMAAEVSSAGLRKPVNEAYPAPSLLDAFRRLNVPVTTASDAHHLDHVADRRSDLRALLTASGYDTLCGFDRRVAREVRL
jgi:histidinol-phosphatase (PHP family)